MRRVLIITYYWPPAGGSGVQRWLKFVKYFREYGIEPVVYTVDKKNHAITDASLPEEIPGGVEQIRSSIIEPGEFASYFGFGKQQSSGFLRNKPGLIGRLLYFIRANCFIPDARALWIRPSVKRLRNYLIENPVDAIISTGPPHSTHLIALGLKQRLGLKWIADFRDPWTTIDYFHQLPLTKRAIKRHKRLENKVLQSADKVVVVSETMRADFSKANKETLTITNGFDSEILRDGSALDKDFTLVHIGLMNETRSPAVLWDTLGELVSGNEEFAAVFKLKLIGKVADSVYKAIRDAGLQDHVEIIDYLPHDKVTRHLGRAQMLLLVVNDVPSAKGIVTGKVFEYLAAGRPIVAIGPEDGDLARILEKTMGGKVIDRDNKVQFKESMEQFYQQYSDTGIPTVSNEDRIGQYHRKNLTASYSKLINSMCA